MKTNTKENYMSKSILALAAASIFAGAHFNDDPLADLGLDLGEEGGVVVDEIGGGAPVAPEATAEAAEKQTRKQVALAPLEFGTIDIIPAQKVGGSKGSKYEFEKLVAPVANPNNASGYDYSFFLAKPEDVTSPDYDEDTFKRSVQSASTAANRAAKKNGTADRYLTRQHIVDGEFVGVLVLRVDGTQAEENDAAE